MILAAALTMHTILSGGVTRQYWEHNAARSGAKAPIVVMLHGTFGTGAGMSRLTGFDAVADRTGAIVVYPQGIGQKYHWNDGRPSTVGADDVSFINHLIDEVANRDGGDSTRVVVAGMSNGAIMALRFGCESDKAQTVVSVAGALGSQEMARCTHHASNVLLVNGDADPLVRYTGSAALLAVEATFQSLARQRDCTTPGLVKTFAKGRDGTAAVIEQTPRCANNARVALITVSGGGHGWPGGSPYLPKAIVGVTSNAFDTSAYIMLFAFGERSK
jgi:polyhydroxybutyrate depolymerase